MSTYTLFADESGLFPGSRRTYWPVGMRILGGLLFQLPVGDANELCRGVIARACDHAEASWYSGPIHAAKLRDSVWFAKKILSCTGVPGAIAEDAGIHATRQGPGGRYPAEHYPLLRLAQRIISSVRQEIGALIANAVALPLLVSEYGLFEDERYSPMANALLAEAAMQIALRSPGECELVAHFDRHRPRRQLSVQPARDGLMAMSKAQKRPYGLRERIEHLDDEVSPGIQLADVFVNALGPSVMQELLPTPREIAERTRADTARTLSYEFFIRNEGTNYPEVDAVAGQRLILQHLRTARTAASRSATHAALKEWLHDPHTNPAPSLPHGMYPVAVESALDSLTRFEAMT